MTPSPASSSDDSSARGDRHHCLSTHGFELIPGACELACVEGLISNLGPTVGPGRRGLLAHPAVAALVRSEWVLSRLRPHLAAEPVPVRAIYFDKSPDANWLVPWHQDLTIALRERIEVPGFGPWSLKEGIPHVQPPVSLLEQMITLRIHLDAADQSNGALRVLPGSHRHGRLTSEQIQTFRLTTPEHLCSAAAGDVLLMRPLLLHASGRSTGDRHRRILHLEFAAFDLPGTLHWHLGA